MGTTIRLLLIGLLLFSIDLYFYQAIKTLLFGSSSYKKNVVYFIYWGFTLFSFLLILVPTFFNFYELPKFFRIYVFAFVIMIFISKIIGSVFIAVDDVIRLFRWGGSFFIKPAVASSEMTPNPHSISRLKFLNYIAVGMAALPFVSFIYGMVKGAFDYKVRNVKVILPQLRRPWG